MTAVDVPDSGPGDTPTKSPGTLTDAQCEAAVAAMDARPSPPGCMARLGACKQRVQQRADNWMERRGLGTRQRLLVWHLLDQLREQVWAVLPITFLLVFVLGAFFQEQASAPWQLTYGLVCAIFGLLFFMDGLRVCVMPLGEMVGSRLPHKYGLPVVLAVAGGLGILVTYAEPAISSLSPLAQLVDKRKAPYLYYALNDQREMLVLSIGLGVGLAAVVGTLRFVKNWSLKPIIYITLVPAIGLACYMQWGNPDLSPLLGLAWDCGAVTTGPVTVPILLAMGIGVMQSQRQKRLARAALQNAVDTNTGQTLEGFGVVTLASLFPVLAVEIMGIMISVTKTTDEIINAEEGDMEVAAVDKSPVREVIFAIRAIMPLVTALLLIILLLIREPLPPLTVYTVGAHTTVDPDGSAHSVSGPPLPPPPAGKGGGTGKGGQDNTIISADSNAVDSLAATSAYGYSDANTVVASPGPSGHGGNAAAAALAAAAVQPIPEAAHDAVGAPGGGIGRGKLPAGAELADPTLDGRPSCMSGVSDAASGAPAHEAAVSIAIPPEQAAHEPWIRRYGGLILGIVMAQCGMIAFNIGLTYGFTSLGDQAGSILPAAYLEVPAFPRSPYYSYAGGIVLVLVTTFCLGFLATRAEPALRVLGATVQHLSRGAFTSDMLIYAVSVGVGCGMAVGSTKILFGVPIIYIILVKYSIATAITIFSEEDFTNIAWDSAGVTTGPVTVPFVLSLGIGFSKATNATEGFGILTAASVAPIISVLLTNLLKRPMRSLVRTVSRSMSRSSSGGLKPSKSIGGIMSRRQLADMSKLATEHKDTHTALENLAVLNAAAARFEADQSNPLTHTSSDASSALPTLASLPEAAAVAPRT